MSTLVEISGNPLKPKLKLTCSLDNLYLRVPTRFVRTIWVLEDVSGPLSRGHCSTVERNQGRETIESQA